MHLIVLCLYKIYLTDQGKCVLDGTVAKVIAIVTAQVNIALTIALITIAIITIGIITIAILTIAIITIA